MDLLDIDVDIDSDNDVAATECRTCWTASNAAGAAVAVLADSFAGAG